MFYMSNQDSSFFYSGHILNYVTHKREGAFKAFNSIRLGIVIVSCRFVKIKDFSGLGEVSSHIVS